MEQYPSESHITFNDWNTSMVSTWCESCGNRPLLMAIKQAFVALQMEPHNTLIVYGVGCAGNTCSWVNTYGVHGLHGRTLPVATGAKLVNPKLTVIAEGGDGDAYGIGLAHFIHSARRNIDITYIVHNNQIYGLTTGQASPTTEKGVSSKSTPCGVIERPINPLALALSSDATYIARGYAGDVAHLKDLILGGISHRGFALIDVFQPCITFNKRNTYDWFKERMYKLDLTDTSSPNYHNVSDKQGAFQKALLWGSKIPIGLFFKEDRLTYHDELDQLGGYNDAVVDHIIADIGINKTLQKFR